MDFFLYKLLPLIFNMSLTASVVIVVVLLARLLLRRAPRWCSWALWAVVLFRLLCPVSLGSAVSLFNITAAPVAETAAGPATLIDYVPVEIAHDPSPEVELPIPVISEVINPALPQSPEPEDGDPLEAPVALMTLGWAAVASVLLFGGLIAYADLRLRLSGSERLSRRVRSSKYIGTAFVVGLVRPKIYLPEGLTERERECVLAHERVHIRRGDFIIKPLAYLALCLHWFNPLVWLAWVLAMRDMEASCDEAAIKSLGADSRADYAQTLLNLATGRRLGLGAALAFGDDTARRIKGIAALGAKKKYISVLAAVLAAAVIAGCAANPAPAGTDEPGSTPGLPSIYEDESGQYADMDAYFDSVLAGITEASVTLAPDMETVSAGVVESRIDGAELNAEVGGLAPEGTLEGWTYRRELRLDVDADSVMLAGANVRDGDWFDFDGQRLAIMLKYPDGSLDVLADMIIVDQLAYYDEVSQYVYDWYVTENGLEADYPLCLVDWTEVMNGGDGTLGNFPARRFDGEGFYVYVPVNIWQFDGSPMSSHMNWLFSSAYSGASVQISFLEGQDAQEGSEPGLTELGGGEWQYVRNVPSGGDGSFAVTARWNENDIAAANSPYAETDIAAARAIADSFTLFENADVSGRQGEYADVRDYISEAVARAYDAEHGLEPGSTQVHDLSAELTAEVSGLAPEGTLQSWAWGCELEGCAANGLVFAQSLADGSCDVLFSGTFEDALEDMGLEYYSGRDGELLYDWYAVTRGLDVPRAVIERADEMNALSGGGYVQYEMRRCDAQGLFYLYIPIGRWVEDPASNPLNQWVYISSWPESDARVLVELVPGEAAGGISESRDGDYNVLTRTVPAGGGWHYEVRAQWTDSILYSDNPDVRDDGCAARLVLESFSLRTELSADAETPVFYQAVGNLFAGGAYAEPDYSAERGRSLENEYVEGRAIRLAGGEIWVRVRHEITGVPEDNTGWLPAAALRPYTEYTMYDVEYPLYLRGGRYFVDAEGEYDPGNDTHLTERFRAVFTETDGGVGRVWGLGGWEAYVRIDDILRPELGKRFYDSADMSAAAAEFTAPEGWYSTVTENETVWTCADAGTAYFRVQSLGFEEYAAYRRGFDGGGQPVNSGVAPPAWIERGSRSVDSGGLVWEAAWHADASDPGREAELRQMYEDFTTANS